MGCCVCVTQENKPVGPGAEIDLEQGGNAENFNDVSLRSESDIPNLKEWIEIKKSKVLTESTSLFSSFTCTKAGSRKGKAASHSGSIVDSFVVSLHKN